MNDGFRAATLKFGLFAIVAILIPVFVPGYALQQVAIAIAYAIAILGLNLSLIHISEPTRPY